MSVETKTAEITSVVVTFCEGQSYDTIYKTIKQRDGAKVFVGTYRDIPDLLESFSNPDKTNANKLVKEIVSTVSDLEPGNVVFNWECCSSCSKHTFGSVIDNTAIIQFVSFIVRKKGYVAMFSDFALKALIDNWDESLLGAKPYINVGSRDDAFKLLFSREHVAESECYQLKSMAQLSTTDSINIHALKDTIEYTIDQEVYNKETPYELQVETVVVNDKYKSKYCQTTDKKYYGLAGHTILKYSSGGLIITSNGHFIELTKLDTSIEKVLQYAELHLGRAVSDSMKKDLYSQPLTMRRVSATQYAQECLQSALPVSSSSASQQQLGRYESAPASLSVKPVITGVPPLQMFNLPEVSLDTIESMSSSDKDIKIDEKE